MAKILEFPTDAWKKGADGLAKEFLLDSIKRSLQENQAFYQEEKLQAALEIYDCFGVSDPKHRIKISAPDGETFTETQEAMITALIATCDQMYMSRLRSTYHDFLLLTWAIIDRQNMGA